MGNIVYTDAVYTALRKKGFDGTTTDMLYQELLGRGYSSDLNTMMFQYLGDVGYTGDLASRLSQVGGIEGYAGCRSVATFNGVSQYVSIPPVTLSGDFEIELTFNTLDTGYEPLVSDAAGQNYIRLLDPQGVQVFLANTAYISDTSTSFADGNDHKLILKRSGLSCVLSVDDVILSSNNISGSVLFSQLARAWNTGAYLNGNVRDIKIWTGGDRNTGTLIRDYPLDDGYANNPVVRNAATELGAEKWAWNGNITSGSQWGSLYVEGVNVFDGNGIEDATRYLVEATLSNIPTGGSLQLRVGASGSQVILNEDKPSATYLVTASGTRLSAVEASTSNTIVGATLNVSIRQADGYGEMINPTEAMWSERCDL